MTSSKTFASERVLEFYKQLPFTYDQSESVQPASIRKSSAVRGYPAL